MKKQMTVVSFVLKASSFALILVGAALAALSAQVIHLRRPGVSGLEGAEYGVGFGLVLCAVGLIVALVASRNRRVGRAAA